VTTTKSLSQQPRTAALAADRSVPKSQILRHCEVFHCRDPRPVCRRLGHGEFLLVKHIAPVDGVGASWAYRRGQRADGSSREVPRFEALPVFWTHASKKIPRRFQASERQRDAEQAEGDEQRDARSPHDLKRRRHQRRRLHHGSATTTRRTTAAAIQATKATIGHQFTADLPASVARRHSEWSRSAPGSRACAGNYKVEGQRVKLEAHGMGGALRGGAALPKAANWGKLDPDPAKTPGCTRLARPLGAAKAPLRQGRRCFSGDLFRQRHNLRGSLDPNRDLSGESGVMSPPASGFLP
jgi:hypothetical protein